jgi:carboxyl-terminal processing protease
LLLAATLLAAGELAAQDSARRAVRPRTTAEDLQLFSQVLNQLRVNHPDSLDTHVLLMAAIEGMIGAADPHSYVLPAIRLDAAKEEQLRSGKLVPVPVAFRYADGAVVVASLAAGSEAARVDILPGDELLTVDGKGVNARSADELTIELAGARGTTVVLGLERRRADGTLARLERRVVRERVGEATAVPAVLMLDSATGYVRVTTFVGEKVAEDLHRAVSDLETRGMRRLVLDLRDNGGGSIEEAASVAGEFLPSGTVVYTAAGRKRELADTGRVKRSFWRREKRYPLLVLINEGTASASELVAGALQDHDRALIVGRPSFGKALMMRRFPMSDGSVMMLVVGDVRTPCGRNVQREYRTITRRDYYRMARAERDTAGRPACRTAGGRTVYGGGGIYPDVVFDPDPPTPDWIARLREQDAVLQWVGGYVEAHAGELSSAEKFAASPELSSSALADFRAFASRLGVAVPTDAASDRVLARVLARFIAFARWGESGFYRVSALLDPEVARALESFARAGQLTAHAR